MEPPPAYPGVATIERQEPEHGLTPKLAYFKTVPGILKILQAVFSILTFILSMSAPWGGHGGGWVNFVSINGFIQAIIWGILHLFRVVPAVLANYFIELIVYALWTLFYFIAGIVAACRGHRFGVVGAAAFFCFLCMVLFGVEAVMQFLDVRARYKARNDRRPVSQTSNNATNEDTLFVRPVDDKGFY